MISLLQCQNLKVYPPRFIATHDCGAEFTNEMVDFQVVRHEVHQLKMVFILRGTPVERAALHDFHISSHTGEGTYNQQGAVLD